MWVDISPFSLLLPLGVLAWYSRRWAVLVLLAGLSAYIIRITIAGVPTTWLELGLYLTLIAFMARGEWRGLRELVAQATPSRLWVLLLWLVAATVGVVVASDTRLALGVWKGFVVNPLLLAFMVVALAHKETNRLRWWRDCVAALLVGATGTTLAAVAQSWLTSAGRLQSGYDSPNLLAMYLAPILVAGVLWLLWPAGRASLKPWGRVVWLGACAIVALGVVGTNSYAAVVAVVGALVLAAVFTHWPRWAPVCGAVIVAASLLLPFVTVVRGNAFVAGHTNITYGTTSGEVRLTLWRQALSFISEHPVFGLGLGQWQPAFIRAANTQGLLSIRNPGLAIELHYSSLYPHNLWLTTWLATGALGLVAMLWLSLTVFGAARARQFILPAAILAVQVLHGALDTPVWRNDLAVLWWVPVILVVLAKRQEQPSFSQALV
ncbi:MAG: O-antigen ligase family protein [Candidatus Veblenbacteria bacterium]|nr:O-antigen ligase family protein [Candidatus Veblenbacteria bacterium]MDZ4229724.1 O-antigen ligase family protein [Candidatus Veblenbacteria bacterium]